MAFFDELADWSRFEDLVQVLFTRRGWRCTSSSAVGQDGGRDLEFETIVDKDLSNYKIKLLIQCKHYGRRAVGLPDVKDIYTIAKSFGVNAYLIATSSRLTTGLQNQLERLDKETDIEFRSLNGSELELEVRRDEDIFKQFLPKAYSLYVETLCDINEFNLSKTFEELFGRTPLENETTELLKLRLMYPTARIDDYRQVWEDKSIRQLLDRLFRKHLKRSVDPIGLIVHGLTLKYNLADEGQIVRNIRNSREYLHLQPKVDLSFDYMPELSVLFDQPGSILLNWWTYHGSDFKGQLEILMSQNGRKYAVLMPSEGRQVFRLAFPIPGLDLEKRNIRIEFRTRYPFEVFALVDGLDHRPYYVGFRSTGKGPNKSNSGGVDYALSYIGKNVQDGRWHVLKRSVSNLLYSRYKVRSKAIKYLCFVVHGEFQIRSIQLS